ncbi:MAG: ATP-binding protein, partial [Steroidobacteraceae bacterium]
WLPDLILLDVNMPDMDGYEVCRRIKGDAATRDIPVIFLTGLADATDERRGFEVGAADYIVKPFSEPVVLARVRSQLALKASQDAMRRQADALLHQREELRRILDHSPVGVAFVAEGIFREVNPAFEALLGVRAGEAHALILPEPSRQQELLARVAIHGVVRHEEMTLCTRSGEPRHALVTLMAFRHDDTDGVLQWVIDISERVRMERMKREFIATVSHELRTPLTSIRGSLAMLTKGVGGELPKPAAGLVDIAHRNSERLILLVNDILDMEKLEAGRMEFALEDLTLEPLIRQALETQRPYGEALGVRYEFEGDLQGLCVRADANRLQQVLANLLSNAAKFSPRGGVVTLRVASLPSCIRLEVRDHGSGIPEAFRHRIFQKFAQADASDARAKGGTGLGLSITQAMVERMGGRIGFTSEPGVLTVFFVEMPPAARAEG